MKVKILVVEDEEILNEYICSLLKNYEVKSAYNGKEAIELLEKEHFHIIISDIIMDEKNGFDLLEYLNKKSLNVPTIMLTAINTEEYLAKAYDLGAIDYIKKPVQENILKKKIANYVKYLYKVTPEFVLDTETKTLKIKGEEINLTKQEFEIFNLLYSNSPRVYTKKNLIDEIWSGNEAMSNKIIEVNIFNIRQKLKQYSKVIKTKRNIGYCYED